MVTRAGLDATGPGATAPGHGDSNMSSATGHQATDRARQPFNSPGAQVAEMVHIYRLNGDRIEVSARSVVDCKRHLSEVFLKCKPEQVKLVCNGRLLTSSDSLGEFRTSDIFVVVEAVLREREIEDCYSLVAGISNARWSDAARGINADSVRRRLGRLSTQLSSFEVHVFLSDSCLSSGLMGFDEFASLFVDGVHDKHSDVCNALLSEIRS